MREFCFSISHVILVQARVRVGSYGKVKQRFKINHDGAEKSQRSRREVGTVDRVFQIGKKLGNVPPFLVQKLSNKSSLLWSSDKEGSALICSYGNVLKTNVCRKSI